MILAAAKVFALIRANKALAAGLGVLALFVVAYGAWLLALHLGAEREARLQEERLAAAITQAVTINSLAREASALERRDDDAATAALEKDRKDAYARTPDQAPSATRLALACDRLRGTAQARLPEFSQRCGSGR